MDACAWIYWLASGPRAAVCGYNMQPWADEGWRDEKLPLGMLKLLHSLEREMGKYGACQSVSNVSITQY